MFGLVEWVLLIEIGTPKEDIEEKDKNFVLPAFLEFKLIENKILVFVLCLSNCSSFQCFWVHIVHQILDKKCCVCGV